MNEGIQGRERNREAGGQQWDRDWWHLMTFQVLEMLNIAHMLGFAKSEIKRKYHHSCLDCVYEIFRSRYRFMNRIIIVDR